MKVVIQKFGGTSVASEERREFVVGHILRAKEEGYHPVVVVSAMGRAGDPYATDTLIGLARSITRDISPRELDLIMSCGEIISSIVLVQALRRHGQRSIALTGAQAGIVTNNQFGRARIVEVKPDKITDILQKGEVPVVAGFQGVTPDGEITTLGRGGSDTTAAALGVALNAELVEIYTDVEGIMTADPRIVPEARILERATYQEIVEMAHLGARVIHPRAVEIAREGRIPLRVRATKSSAPGTLICSATSEKTVEIRSDRIISGIAHVSGATYVQVHSTVDFNRTGVALEILSQVADMDVSIDLILVSPYRLSFITCSDCIDRLSDLFHRLGVEGSVEQGYAKVSAVGAGMAGVPGVMAKIAKALHERGVDIYQTTDSHCNISCLVRDDDLPTAVRALHEAFGLAQR